MTGNVDPWRTQKVEIWNEDYSAQESKREYVVVREIRGVQESGDYYRRQDSVDVTLYLDSQTGLVVFDVAAYEKSLEARS